MKKGLNYIVLTINLLFALVLFACALVPMTNPNSFWPIVFAGLGFLVWLLINVFFALYWMLSLKKWFIISVLAILVNFNNIAANIGTTQPVERGTGFTLGVATLNTQLFGYFDDDKKESDARELTVISRIKELNPDILCFQEFLALDQYDLDFYKRKLGFKHAYFKVLHDGRKRGRFGMVVFSRYPILSAGGMEFSQYTGNMGAWIETEVNGKRIKVINVHLQSIRFSKADYKVLEKDKTEINVEESKTLLRRIKNAACIRADQVNVLCKKVENSELPVVLCGDFNEPPVSYSYGQVTSLLCDAYTQTTFGLETTYTGKFPAFRIDYIFHDKAWKALSYESRTVPSDHKLVFSKIQFNQ